MTESGPEVLAQLWASAPRRLFALVMLGALGALLLYMAVTNDAMNVLSRLFVLGLGGAVLMLADSMRRATVMGLILTRETLRDSSGRVLARVEDMQAVVRGTFSMKPTHGFSVSLKSRGPWVWAPGMWWRFGTRLGIGGVTAAAHAKLMSEILAALIMERDGGPQ